jgi:hypothetical protein
MQNTQTFQIDNAVLEETQSPLSPPDFAGLAFTYTDDSFTYTDALSPPLRVQESKNKYKAGDRAARREVAEEKAQALKGRIDTHLTELHELLKNGHSDKVKELFAYFATFHHYSLGNQILIAFQRPDALFVAGYKAWEEKGRTVKKGEHGIAILAPMIGKKRVGGEGKTQESDDKEPVVYGFRAVYVFDVAQTEGEPIPEMYKVKGEATGHLDRLKRYVAEQGITLEYVESLEGAHGRSYMGKIALIIGREPAEEFRTLAHEIAHEILHPDIVIRQALSKTVKETEAEAVAFVVCQAMGLDMSTVSQDYIQLYQGSPEMLTASLERIRVASNTILTGLENGKKAAQDKPIAVQDKPPAQNTPVLATATTEAPTRTTEAPTTPPPQYVTLSLAL